MTGSNSKHALITGASRGVGAQTAKNLAAQGFHVYLNYRDKAARAEAVAAEIAAAGGSATPIQADITSPESVHAMYSQIGELDILVLNASGGMEKGKAEAYPMLLNRDAQLEMLTAALPRLKPGGRVVFVTSHQAHFYPESEVVDAYKPVAASKKAGEDALLAKIPELAAQGLSLVVVSGAMIDGTITPRLLERAHPGILEERRREGKLISIEEFASKISRAALDGNLESGAVILAGALG